MTCAMFIASANAQRALDEQNQRFDEAQRLIRKQDEEFQRQLREHEAQQGLVIDVEAREVSEPPALPPP